MKKLNLMLSFLFVFFLCFSSIDTNAQEINYDNFDSYEQMLNEADLVVYGSVINTKIWEDTITLSKSIIKRDVFFDIEEIVKNNLHYTKHDICFITIDSILENNKEMIVHVPPKPEKGEKFIALIVKRGDKFRLIHDDSCLIPVSEGKLTASETEVADYIQDIKAFITSEKDIFDGYKPSMYNVRHDISHAAHKIVTGSNDYLREIGGKYFRFNSRNRPTSSSVTYKLNSSGGG